MNNFKSRFKLGELFGIPIYLDITFAIILLIFFFDMSVEYAVPFTLVLAISIVLHELGHSLTARAFGFPTRDITLSLLGGCASLLSLPKKAYQEFLTAIAGPMVSFAIAIAANLVLNMLPFESEGLAMVIYFTQVMNLTLGLFNLLPALPMDGGRVFRSFMRFFVTRVKATYIAMWVGRVVAIALVALPFFGVRHLGPIPIGGYFFIRLMIAWMIWQEGRREYLLARSESDYRHWTQDDFKARVSPPPYAR